MRNHRYSNKGGVLFNLLRDDLGHMPDATALNYENAYSRGVVAGLRESGQISLDHRGRNRH